LNLTFKGRNLKTPFKVMRAMKRKYLINLIYLDYVNYCYVLKEVLDYSEGKKFYEKDWKYNLNLHYFTCDFLP
jgi:hypothetical protein